MFLKRVDMKNFKSFREVSVPLEPGFTGITGPNGSGKSNISDAILFVLGTKSSKQIRAGRLGDLIHNGGKDGKAAKECRVSLIFDNTDRTMPLDTDEVKLTRRVKKSPSDPTNTYSYYYVNGESSSLTEFEELLSHARISADGYNIVQQGDVTQIVTMSNVERRKLLDETAGITRFDKEIDEAEARRGDVEDNLDRTRLILREVNQTLKTLAREKERAAEYRDLQENLQGLKTKLAKKRVLALEQELKNVHESIASYEEEGDQLRAKRAKVDERVQALTARMDELDEEMAELGGDEARERQEQLQELREQASTARQMRNHFKDEVQGVEIDLQETQALHKQAEQALTEVQEEREEVANALSTWRKEAQRIDEEL
ncbi:MAG: AAA family ATPase, partial [Candidatus Thermoplasmatota archaeon]|nr:AAA family ATPase [Candidatus Thermoplasmatota archaeon]